MNQESKEESRLLTQELNSIEFSGFFRVEISNKIYLPMNNRFELFGLAVKKLLPQTHNIDMLTEKIGKKLF